MKTLIIYAHPNVRGHNQAILAEVTERLSQKGIEYSLINLYANRFDPVLKASELYSAGNRKVTEKNLGYQRRIRAAKRLIFIYPVWWDSMPAILKGFIDRVLVAGFAFRMRKSVPVKLLKGRKAAVFISSGSSSFISWLVFRNRADKLIARDILGFCGIKARVFRIDRATRMTPGQHAAIRKRVSKGLDWLYG